MDSFETKDQVFDLLNKTFHYFDIPNVFSADEKMEQLFDEQGDRKEMVLDYKNMDEAYSDLFRRIKENLLMVMTMTLVTRNLSTLLSTVFQCVQQKRDHPDV